MNPYIQHYYYPVASNNETLWGGSTFQTLSSTCDINQWAADVTARVALPQIRVETLIGSQATFEIINNDTFTK